MACINKALIVGGGPAGLTAAAALRQVGVACDLVEITTTGAPLGTAITLTGRSVDVLTEIGVMKELQEIHGDLGEGLNLANLGPDGAPLPVREGALPEAGRAKLKTMGLYRPLLSAVIRERAMALGASMRLETTVVGLQHTQDGVEVEFNDGSTDTYDMVVGADGLRSRVRSLVFGNVVAPQLAGQYVLRWMAPGPPIEVGHPSHYFASFGRMLGYPLPRQNLIYVAVVLHKGPARHVHDAEARQMMREVLESLTAPYAIELRKRLTDDQVVLYRPYEWLLVPPPWYRGRVILIGDAAHSTTAHMAAGGGMAVEDAAVLAQSVDSQSTLEDAFETFMQRRFGRVRLVVESSLALSRLEESGASPDELSAYGGEVFRTLAQAY